MTKDEKIKEIISGLIELGFDLRNKENIKSFITSVLSQQSLDEISD